MLLQEREQSPQSSLADSKFKKGLPYLIIYFTSKEALFLAQNKPKKPTDNVEGSTRETYALDDPKPKPVRGGGKSNVKGIIGWVILQNTH